MRSTSTSSTRTFITPSPTPEAKPPRRPIKLKLPTGHKLPWIVIIILLLLSLFLFVQYKQAQHKLAAVNNPAASTKQVQSTISQVAKIAVLPPGETPTVATVVHASQLKNQNFFANSKDGDKVLIYSKQKEAILYRPSTNQIVIIAPVSVGANGSPQLGAQ